MTRLSWLAMAGLMVLLPGIGTASAQTFVYHGPARTVVAHGPGPYWYRPPVAAGVAAGVAIGIAARPPAVVYAPPPVVYAPPPVVYIPVYPR